MKQTAFRSASENPRATADTLLALSPPRVKLPVPKKHFANVWQISRDFAKAWQKLKPARRMDLPMFGKFRVFLPMFGKTSLEAESLPRGAEEAQGKGADDPCQCLANFAYFCQTSAKRKNAWRMPCVCTL